MCDVCVRLQGCVMSVEHVVNILSVTEGDPWLQCLEFVHAGL